MAGMEYTFSADVAPFVGALDAAIGAAKRFESAVHGARDAEMELGASGAEAAAGLAAQTAAMDAAASSADRLNRQHRQLGTALRDSERVARDAGIGIGDLERAAGAAASAGGGLSNLTGMLGQYAMPAAIATLVTAAAAAAPALVSAGLGFGSFAALAYPALSKVKTGLTSVTTAQAAYTKAKAIEARDPTTAHLAAEQRALLNLRTTWSQMPAPVAATVRGIRSFEHAWSRVGQRSGIQKAALGDIQKVMKIGKDLTPTIASLAKAAAPAISHLLNSVDKGVRSGGFRKFMHGMSTEIGPATRALTRLGGAGLGLVGSTLEKLKPISAPFLNSLSRLTRVVTPGIGTTLSGAASGLTKLMNAASDSAPGLGAIAHDIGQIAKNEAKLATGDGGTGLGKFSPKNLSAGVKQAQAMLNNTMKQLHIGGGIGSDLGSAFRRAFSSFIPGLSELHLGNALSKIGPKIPVTIKPKIEGSGANLAKELDASQALKAHAATVRVKVKADPGDVKRQVADAAKGGGNIPLKGKVTLTGLKSGIQQQIASLHIPSSKVKISVSVAGVGSAKAAMASVVGAARKDAAAAAAALNSLGAAGAAAGRALDQGLAGGILAGESGVVSAAAQVAGAAAAAARKAAGIASPSKVWHGIGRNMIQGLLLGLQGGKAQVQAAARAITGAAAPFKDAGITSTIKKLREDVRKAFRAGDIGKHQRDGLIDFIDHGNQRLMHLAQQRAKIMGQIRAATALAKSVTQGAIASADITGIAGTIAGDKNTGKAAPTIQEAQKEQLGKIRQFTHAIKQLKREGLDKTSIKQLLAAGVSGGLPAAQQLLAEGPKAVKESARLQKEIAKAARGLGVTGANAAYESASQIGKGLAAGLRASLKPVVAAMRDIARALIATLRKELGLKPGEGLGGLLGGGGGGGGAGGGGAGHHRRHHKPPDMRMLPGGPGGLIHPGGPPMIMHPGSGGPRGGPPVIHTHITVQLNGMQVGSAVQTSQLRHARRNIATGIKLPSRAA